MISTLALYDLLRVALFALETSILRILRYFSRSTEQPIRFITKLL